MLCSMSLNKWVVLCPRFFHLPMEMLSILHPSKGSCEGNVQSNMTDVSCCREKNSLGYIFHLVPDLFHSLEGFPLSLSLLQPSVQLLTFWAHKEQQEGRGRQCGDGGRGLKVIVNENTTRENECNRSKPFYIAYLYLK